MLRTTGAKPVAAVAIPAILMKSRRESLFVIVGPSAGSPSSGAQVSGAPYSLRPFDYAQGGLRRTGLLVASQAVCQASHLLFMLFQMTVQAPAHVHLHDRMDDLHLANLAMAGFAVEARAQVRLMAEVYEVGLRVDAHPGDGFAAFPIAGNFLDQQAIRGNHTVASHAFLHRGNAGNVRT